MANFKKGPLTEADKEFIRNHFKTMPVREICKRLGRGGKIIYDYVKEANISPINGSKDTRHHPWRKANYQLEINKQIRQKQKEV